MITWKHPSGNIQVGDFMMKIVDTFPQQRLLQPRYRYPVNISIWRNQWMCFFLLERLCREKSKTSSLTYLKQDFSNRFKEKHVSMLFQYICEHIPCLYISKTWGLSFSVFSAIMSTSHIFVSKGKTGRRTEQKTMYTEIIVQTQIIPSLHSPTHSKISD